jgi:hypothetical protein
MKAAFAGVIALLALTGCSDDPNDATADFEVVVELDPVQTDARRFDQDEEATTGALVLEGDGRGPDGDVGVVVWGLFNYRDDEGDFAAAVEFDFGDGNVLYAHGNTGRTTRTADGAHVEAEMTIIGGTGEFEGRRGEVVYSADRAVTVGSPLVATLRGWFDDQGE